MKVFVILTRQDKGWLLYRWYCYRLKTIIVKVRGFYSNITQLCSQCNLLNEIYKPLKVVEKNVSSLEGTTLKNFILGMADMPFLCRDLYFLPKLSYHRNVSLAVYSPILYFSFCQKTNLHSYKQSICLVSISPR